VGGGGCKGDLHGKRSRADPCWTRFQPAPLWTHRTPKLNQSEEFVTSQQKHICERAENARKRREQNEKQEKVGGGGAP